MGDIVITPDNVLCSDYSILLHGVAGEQISAGDVCYQSSSDQKFYRAFSIGTQAQRTPAGIARNGAYAGQPLHLVEFDPNFTFGGTVASGSPIYLSENYGKISDTPTSAVVLLGVATSTTTMALEFIIGGIEIPTFDSTYLFTFDETEPVTFDMAK